MSAVMAGLGWLGVVGWGLAKPSARQGHTCLVRALACAVGVCACLRAPVLGASCDRVEDVLPVYIRSVGTAVGGTS
jgi:hypothetical protein